MNKGYKFLLALVIAFVYFNVGSLYINHTIISSVNDEKDWLHPIDLTSNLISSQGEETNIQFIRENSGKTNNEIIEKHCSTYPTWHYFSVIVWPVIFIASTLWQWLLVAIDFIFLGGLLNVLFNIEGGELFIIIIILFIVLVTIALIEKIKGI